MPPSDALTDILSEARTDSGSESSPLRSKRALSFGAIASNYDTYRQSYPDEMIDDIVDLIPGRRVAEIGAGTGKATVGFARHELELTCVEPDPGMAEVLRTNCATESGDRVTIQLATFEEFRPTLPFDAIVSAQAWHWTDPATRWDHAASMLTSGGIIALFWNDEAWGSDGVHHAIEDVYDRHLPGNAERPFNRWRGQAGGRLGDEIAEHPAFDYMGARVFDRVLHYTADRYASLHQTQSVVNVQPPEVRQALFEGTVAAINEHGGHLSLECHTTLHLGRRV